MSFLFRAHFAAQHKAATCHVICSPIHVAHSLAPLCINMKCRSLKTKFIGLEPELIGWVLSSGFIHPFTWVQKFAFSISRKPPGLNSNSSLVDGQRILAQAPRQALWERSERGSSSRGKAAQRFSFWMFGASDLVYFR